MASSRKALANPNPRAHRVLFDTSLPFRPRTERSAKDWQRQPKHKAAENRNNTVSGWW